MIKLSRSSFIGALACSAVLAAPTIASAAVDLADEPVVLTSDRPHQLPGDTLGRESRIWATDSPFRVGDVRQISLFPGGVSHRSPDWAPNRSAIVFVAPFDQANPSFAGLWLVNPVTGATRQIVSNANGLDFPAWSPDGTKIAYVSDNNLRVLTLADLPEDEEVAAEDVPIVATNVPKEKPSWSPGGTTLYFTRLVARQGQNVRGIWKVSPIDGDDRQETEVIKPLVFPFGGGLVRNASRAAVSPDGKALCLTVVGTTAATAPTVASVNLATPTTITAIPNAAGDAQQDCAWSPNGANVIFTKTPAAAAQGTTSDLAVLTRAGGVPLNILDLGQVGLRTSSFDGAADWAPGTPGIDETPGDGDGPPGDGPPGGGGTPIGGGGGTPIGGGGGGNPGGGGGPVPPAAPASTLVMNQIKVSPASWLLGHALPAVVPSGARVKASVSIRGRVSGKSCVTATRFNRTARACKRTAVGTTISFQSNQAATATVGFQRVLRGGTFGPTQSISFGFQRVQPGKAGRTVGKKCVKQTSKNRAQLPCTRYAKPESLTQISVAQGINRLKFEGRLSRNKGAKGRLVRGAKYRIVLVAKDKAGVQVPLITGPTLTVAKKKFTLGKRR